MSHCGRAAQTSLGALLVLLVLAYPPRPAKAQGDAPTASASESGTLELSTLTGISELDLESLLLAPVVEAASRREQSIHDAPDAVTLLDAETLRDLPVESVPQALTRVPGLHLLQATSADYLPGMRGFNSGSNNRVLVLVDGQVFRGITGQSAIWNTMPLHLMDLERIEVLRGPGSTLYGANGTSGVISLRTRRGIDHPGTKASGSAGMSMLPPAALDQLPGGPRNLGGDAFVGHGFRNQAGALGGRVSVSMGQGSYSPRDELVTAASHGEFRLTARAGLDWRPEKGFDLQVDLAGVQQESRFLNGGCPCNDARDSLTGRAALQYERPLDLPINLTAQLDIRQRQSQAGDNAVLLAREAHQLLLLDLDVPMDLGIFTMGADTTQNEQSSDSQVNAIRNYAAIVGQLDLHTPRSIGPLLNLGLRAERISVSDANGGRLVYRNLSPRGALIWKINRDQDLRLGLSTGYQTPTLFETLVGVRLPVSSDGSIPDVRIRVARPISFRNVS